MASARQALGRVGEAREELVHRAALRTHRLRAVDLLAERGGARKRRAVPVQVLARDAHAELLAVERVVIVEVLQDDGTRFGDRRWRQQPPRFQVMHDLAKNPGSPLRSAADHQSIHGGA